MTFITTFLKKFFDAELLFTVTGSVTYEIKSENVYEEFFKHKHSFDFSNFSKDLKFYDNQNKMIFGKTKVAHKRIPINIFVGLKSKMYSMLSDDGKESNTAKEVKLCLSLMNIETFYLIKKYSDTKWKEFKVKKYKLGTYEINKISLPCFDDKRFVLSNGIHTLAYFHKDLRK